MKSLLCSSPPPLRYIVLWFLFSLAGIETDFLAKMTHHAKEQTNPHQLCVLMDLTSGFVQKIWHLFIHSFNFYDCLSEASDSGQQTIGTCEEQSQSIVRIAENRPHNLDKPQMKIKYQGSLSPSPPTSLSHTQRVLLMGNARREQATCSLRADICHSAV